MQIGVWSKRAVATSAFCLLVSTMARGDDAPAPATDVAAEINALKARIADLEAKQQSDWMTAEHTAQIKQIVADVLKDAGTHSQFADGPSFGYSAKDGFYIQDASENNKLIVGGFIQTRYQGSVDNAYNGRTLPSRTVGTGSVTPDDPADTDGWSIRRARVNFGGNIFTKDLTFKLEGDFYGNATGNFTVTDAFVAYRFMDALKMKIGSFKVPFTRAQWGIADPYTSFMERTEVQTVFDPIRALGFSVYGDLIKDQLYYEVNVNDGYRTNALRQPDTVGGTANLDNRMAYYARVQWAGSGKISDFMEEYDLRADNRDFIWMLGGAVGYESQNATNNAFPSPQTTQTIQGLSGPNGFIGNYTLNGDVYKATVDWSAKYQGFTGLLAAYFQQVNANPGNTSSTSATTITTGPYGSGNSSFFEHGYTAQVGYFIIPQHLELVGRAGVLLTDGLPNAGEFYSVGANYYVYGSNFKIQSDVTYTPEAAYTDSAAGILQNTHDIIYRVQVQIKF